MAKANAPSKPKAAPTEAPEVVVAYDLLLLPTAFHKAGLAGLILLIESLTARRALKADEAQYEITAAGATITFTEALVRKLMDDLYDAITVEIAVKSKWQGAKLKGEKWIEEEVGGKRSRTKLFVYEQVQPKGAFFAHVFDGEKEPWLKLWRNMLWSIPRGRPTTREPYNQRAAGNSCKEGPNAWSELLAVNKARTKGEFRMAELSSALLPGAQAVNAEGVPFEGRAEENLLLHFWPLTVLLFVPQSIDVDGKTDFIGYTLAVPEVSNLMEFVGEYPKLLASLSSDKRGYRPAQAVIDLPAEGAISFLENLAVIAGLRTEEGPWRFCVQNIEYWHLVKEGNNVKTMAAGRVNPIPKLIVGYRAIMHPMGAAPRYRNPLFRRGLLAALLDDVPWYRRFGPTLATFDVGAFIRRRLKSEVETGQPHFADDVARKFRHETNVFTEKFKRYRDMSKLENVQPRINPEPAVIINRVVRSYLSARTQQKTRIKLDSFSDDDERVDWAKVPAEFNDAKNQLAESLFLEFRSRRDQAFVDHFSATFFSVSQRLSAADRLELANLLTAPDRREDLKTLTLLSLSANS